MQLLHLTRINKSLEVDVIFKAWDFKVSFVWKAIFHTKKELYFEKSFYPLLTKKSSKFK